MSLLVKSCPEHGGRRTELIPADVGSLGPEDPMVVCVACMEDGASPGGAWSAVVPNVQMWACRECGSLVLSDHIEKHNAFHGVPFGRRFTRLDRRFSRVAVVPDLAAEAQPRSIKEAT